MAVRKAKKRGKRRKRKPGKRGPKSLRERVVLPKYMGLKQRKVKRVNEFRSNESMKSYRKGYNVMWRKCPQYMKRIKSAKEPGEFNKKNAHQGKLWGSSKECQLTGRQASLILEKCYEAGCTYAQLKKVKSSLSYAYFLTTGKLALNYKEVWDMWATLGDFEPPTTSIKPTRIPTPEDLKTAWTTPWHKDCGMSLVKWTVAMLIAHDWAIAGARSKEDLKRIKNSIDHEVNTKE